MVMHVAGLKVDAAAVTDPEWTPGTVAGTFDGTSYKEYKYMKYDDGTAAVAGIAGEVAYYVASTGYAANTVTSDLSDSSEVGAGVLQVAMETDTYAWFQIRGHATLSIALTTDEDGTPLTPTGTGDGSLEVVGAFTEHTCAVSINGGDKTIICQFPY